MLIPPLYRQSDVATASLPDQNEEVIGKNLELRRISYHRALRIATGTVMNLVSPRDVHSQVIAKNPFDYMAWIDYKAMGFDEADLARFPWISTVQHRLLLVAVLGGLCFRDEKEADTLIDTPSFAYFAYSAGQIQNLVEEVLQAHPNVEGVQMMSESLMPKLMFDFHVALQRLDNDGNVVRTSGPFGNE